MQDSRTEMLDKIKADIQEHLLSDCSSNFQDMYDCYIDELLQTLNLWEYFNYNYSKFQNVIQVTEVWSGYDYGETFGLFVFWIKKQDKFEKAGFVYEPYRHAYKTVGFFSAKDAVDTKAVLMQCMLPSNSWTEYLTILEV